MSQPEDSDSPANAEIPEIRQYTDLPKDSERKQQAHIDLNNLSNDRGYTKAQTFFKPDDGEDLELEKHPRDTWIRLAEWDDSTNHLSGTERDNPDYQKHLVVLRCQLDLKKWHERRACHFADKFDWDFNFGGYTVDEIILAYLAIAAGETRQSLLDRDRFAEVAGDCTINESEGESPKKRVFHAWCMLWRNHLNIEKPHNVVDSW